MLVETESGVNIDSREEYQEIVKYSITPILEKITTIHKNLQVYKPLPNSTGPNHWEYRDCIDIAVKIAFGLNKMAWTTINSETAIKTNKFFIAISNNKDIDLAIINKNITTRIKQASDMYIVEKFHKVEKVISANFLMIYQKYAELYAELTARYKETLTSGKNYSDILEELVSYNELCINELSDRLNSEHATLIGDTDEAI